MSKWKYLTVPLDDQAFEALASLATKNGSKLDQQARRIIEEGLELAAENKSNPLDVALYAMKRRIERSASAKTVLLTTAKYLSENPDTALAEEFESMCHRAGYDHNEIMTEANLFASTSKILIAFDNSSSAIATEFLLQKFKPGQTTTIPVSVLRREWEKMGYTYSTLDKAATNLGIIRKKVSSPQNWIWIRQSKEDEARMDEERERVEIAESVNYE